MSEMYSRVKQLRLQRNHRYSYSRAAGPLEYSRSVQFTLLYVNKLPLFLVLFIFMFMFLQGLNCVREAPAYENYHGCK